MYRYRFRYLFQSQMYTVPYYRRVPYRHEHEPRDPEHEVEEEHGVLDTGGDVCKSTWDTPPHSCRPVKM
jgi:hypothetical protein